MSQTITGAALESVVYDTDEALNKITSVTLTFTDAAADADRVVPLAAVVARIITPTFVQGSSPAAAATRCRRRSGSPTSVASRRRR